MGIGNKGAKLLTPEFPHAALFIALGTLSESKPTNYRLDIVCVITCVFLLFCRVTAPPTPSGNCPLSGQLSWSSPQRHASLASPPGRMPHQQWRPLQGRAETTV